MELEIEFRKNLDFHQLPVPLTIFRLDPICHLHDFRVLIAQTVQVGELRSFQMDQKRLEMNMKVSSALLGRDSETVDPDHRNMSWSGSLLDQWITLNIPE